VYEKLAVKEGFEGQEA